ncbi:MAG: hypothetical protein QXU44_04720 [Candidatus Caldarchaeum sp.]
MISPILAYNLYQLQLTGFYQFLSTVDGSTARYWQVPPYDLGWSGHMSDYFFMKFPFERTDLNYYYVAAVASSAVDKYSPQAGKTGDVIAARLQIERLSSMERAIRSRHMTHIRARAYSAAKRLGHSMPYSVLYSPINTVSDILIRTRG